MARDDDELQQRVCRACNQTYDYPVQHSTASRFYCEACMELPAPVRATFEQFNKRVKSLTSTVQKLEQKLFAGGGTPPLPAKSPSLSPPYQGGARGGASDPPSGVQESPASS